MLELDLLRAPRPSRSASPRWKSMATLHRPMARCPRSSSAWVTMPTGLVKSTSQAPGAARRSAPRRARARPARVRSALAKPPGPVVSWPDAAEPRAAASRPAAAPPGRRRAAARGRSRRHRGRPRDRPSRRPPIAARRRGEHPARQAGHDGQPLEAGSSSTTSSTGRPARPTAEALDELRRVGAAAADDRRPSATSHLRACVSRVVARRRRVLVDRRRACVPRLPYNIISKATARRRTASRGERHLRRMARFLLRPGPVPLHHQVYLDLRGALDRREWRPGDRLPTGARAGPPTTGAA